MTSETTLPPFGSFIEDRRRELGLTKQGLARRMGISRVHLWRATTGRTSFSRPELLALAEVLGMPVQKLEAVLMDAHGGQWDPEDSPPAESLAAPTSEERAMEDYLGNLSQILATLRNFPGGDMGRRLKLEYLNGVEEIARDIGQRLPLRYWDLRRRVQEDEAL